MADAVTKTVSLYTHLRIALNTVVTRLYKSLCVYIKKYKYNLLNFLETTQGLREREKKTTNDTKEEREVEIYLPRNL